MSKCTNNESCTMVRGATDVETMRLNGWGLGDILESKGHVPMRILITAISDTSISYKCDYNCLYDFVDAIHILNDHVCTGHWVKVDSITLHNCDMLSEALRIAKKYLKADDFPTHCEHDKMFLCITPSEVNVVDTAKLEELSFTPDHDGESFSSYRFGSA